MSPIAAILAIALAVRQAGGFLDECPMDRDLSVGGVPVVVVLETFYKDLALVRALQASRQPRDYSAIVAEIEHMRSLSRRDAALGAKAKRVLFGVVALLKQNKLSEARSLLAANRSLSNGWPMAYYKFLRAEADLLAKEACPDAVLSAFIARREAYSVSANELERLDGLLALRKVSQFNEHVDRLYGLRQSPDYALLPVAQALFKDDSGPLSEVRTAIFDRKYWTGQSAGRPAAPRYDVQRVREPDDFSGQSLPDAAARGILCEFGRKLSTLGLDTNHTGVINQARQLDAELADALQDSVGAGAHLLRARARAAAAPDDETGRSFVTYFEVELFLRSPDRCNLRLLIDLQAGVDRLTHVVRLHHRGVSLGKLAELEAKFALNWLACFHERVRLAFELSGAENEPLLRAKRARLGSTCTRTLPESAMFARIGTDF